MLDMSWRKCTALFGSVLGGTLARPAPYRRWPTSVSSRGLLQLR